MLIDYGADHIKTFTNIMNINNKKKLHNTPQQDQLITLKTHEDDDDPCFDCMNPCSTHPSYPSYLRINYELPLEGTVKPHTKHVLISTGKTDWMARIEDDSTSLAGQLHKIIKSGDSKNKKEKKAKKKEDKRKNFDSDNNETQQIFNADNNVEKSPRMLITNSSRENTDKDSKGNDVLLFPDNILIRNVDPMNALEFSKRFLLPSLSSNQDQNTSSITFQVDPNPYKAVIVICSHRRRDKRCGVVAPILKDEFDKILKDKKLDVENKKTEGVAVFLSSHIGGHKFAGNVIVFRDGQGIWYGRVIPCHAKSIIEYTVIEGKVIKDLYRGSINGSFAPGKGGRLDW
nr:4708_t:CDS:2 [Entrophospora candida]